MISNDEHVEVAVQVVIAERRHEGSVHDIQAKALRGFDKSDRIGGSRFVNVKLVRRIVIADINVEIPIVIDIDHRCAGSPRFAAMDARVFGCIPKAHGAGRVGFTYLKIQPVFYRTTGKENVLQFVAINIPDRDTAGCAGALRGANNKKNRQPTGN